MSGCGMYFSSRVGGDGMDFSSRVGGGRIGGVI